MTYMTAPMKATDEMPLSIPVCMKRSTSSAEDSAASTPAMPKSPRIYQTVLNTKKNTTDRSVL